MSPSLSLHLSLCPCLPISLSSVCLSVFLSVRLPPPPLPAVRRLESPAYITRQLSLSFIFIVSLNQSGPCHVVTDSEMMSCPSSQSERKTCVNVSTYLIIWRRRQMTGVRVKEDKTWRFTPKRSTSMQAPRCATSPPWPMDRLRNLPGREQW